MSDLITHRITRNWIKGSETLTSTETIEATAENNRNVPVPAGQTVEFDLDFVAANLKLFYARSNVAVTLKTNASDETADDTIEIPAAGRAVEWTPSSGLANPFSADVTTAFLTNAGEDDAVVKIRSLVDSVVEE